MTDTNIVTISVSSIFLPYYLTGITLISLALYILINKRTRAYLLIHKCYKLLMTLFTFLLVVPMAYGNWIGITAGIGLILAFVLGQFQRCVMTRELFENLLTLVCKLSLTSAVCALIDKFLIPLIDHDFNANRISAVFFYPNYFGTIAATVIIICAYKVLSQRSGWFFCLIGAVNVISLYLCESMFAFVEVFIGIAVLLVLYHRKRLFLLWLILALGGVAAVLGLNLELIPRLSDADLTTKLRIHIWAKAVDKIRENPLIGHGSMTYAFESYRSGALVMHAHSLYLDSFLNYGILGVLLFLWYFADYYLSVLRTCFKEKQLLITTLILSVTGAALVHGMVDLTLLWVQTLPLFLFILSGYGAYEKEENAPPPVLIFPKYPFPVRVHSGSHIFTGGGLLPAKKRSGVKVTYRNKNAG